MPIEGMTCTGCEAHVVGALAGAGARAAQVDLAALVGQKDELVRRLRREKYEELIAQYGWDIVRGEASFVDEHARTSNPRVFAAGDVTLAPQFVYMAEGLKLAAQGFGRDVSKLSCCAA